MDEFVLDLEDGARPAPRPARLGELRERAEREARDRARRYGATVKCEAPRRAADVALLWFEGERTAVLRAVGGWVPGDDDLELQIAHASARGPAYELAVYVVVRAAERGSAA